MSQNDEFIKGRIMIAKQEVVAYGTLDWCFNFVKSYWGNTDMFSKPYFQVQIGLKFKNFKELKKYDF